jgi:hypothetical protein
MWTTLDLGADVFAVEVDGYIVVEGDDGQRALGLRLGFELHRSVVAGGAAFFEALADVVLGNDGRLLLEELVSTGVVLVVVGIDDEADGLVGDALECGLNLVGERGILVVNHDDAIVTYRSPDVAACALQHVYVAGDFNDLDLDFAEIVILGYCQRAEECESDGEFAHAEASWLRVGAL